MAPHTSANHNIIGPKGGFLQTGITAPLRRSVATPHRTQPCHEKIKKNHGEHGGHGEKPNFDQAFLRVLRGSKPTGCHWGSVIVRKRSQPTSCNRCRTPLGHWISTDLAVMSLAIPKCTVLSLEEP